MRFAWLVLGGFGFLGACGGSVFTAEGTAAAGAAGLSVGGASAGDTDGDAGEPVTPAGGSSDGGSSSGGSSSGGAASAGAAHGGAAHGGSASGGAATGGGGASSAGAGGAAAASCPAMPPVAGKACSPSLTCSYGDDPRPACRDRYECTKDKWVATHPVASACGPIADCSMTPSGFPVVGHECNTLGEECSFDGGASGTIYCRCNFCGTDSSCPAGMADWACAGPPIAPCPETLPNEGQACEKKQSCFYGVECEGVGMHCDGKTWSTESAGCAN